MWAVYPVCFEISRGQLEVSLASPLSGYPSGQKHWSSRWTVIIELKIILSSSFLLDFKKFHCVDLALTRVVIAGLFFFLFSFILTYWLNSDFKKGEGGNGGAGLCRTVAGLVSGMETLCLRGSSAWMCIIRDWNRNACVWVQLPRIMSGFLFRYIKHYRVEKLSHGLEQKQMHLLKAEVRVLASDRKLVAVV